MLRVFSASVFFLFSHFLLLEGNSLYLRNHLIKANTGDYLVTMQNSNYTLLLIREKGKNQLIMEEITVAANRMPRQTSWKEWVKKGACFHTSWIAYTLDLSSGCLRSCFSFSKRSWMDKAQAGQFLTTLLNLPFRPIPFYDRKKLSSGKFWQPPLIVDGQRIPGVQFGAFRAKWPNDRSQLSSLVISIYLPEESERYPSFFPYWLEVKGFVGKAKVRIIDSGSGLSSPQTLPRS